MILCHVYQPPTQSPFSCLWHHPEWLTKKDKKPLLYWHTQGPAAFYRQPCIESFKLDYFPRCNAICPSGKTACKIDSRLLSTLHPTSLQKEVISQEWAKEPEEYRTRQTWSNTAAGCSYYYTLLQLRHEFDRGREWMPHFKILWEHTNTHGMNAPSYAYALTVYCAVGYRHMSTEIFMSERTVGC